jgi:uncharacterized membrane protein YgdD (TMEM256/DUF423 family)
MPKAERWIMIGAVSAAAAIGAGAFGAHGLRKILDARHLEIFETAARYHLIHALALVLVGVLAAAGWQRTQRVAVAFVIGTVVFSGSLYALAISGIDGLGAITPIGGVAFISGWLMLADAARRR